MTVCAILGHPLLAGAQDPAADAHPKVELAVGTWISVGDTRWSHNAESPLLGNPTSKLTYKDVGTNVIDLAGTLWFTPKVFGRLNVGFASIGGGRLTDDDYLAADGGNPSSRTSSDLKGDGMWYLNADVGGRVVNFANHRGWLDLFAGLQYWHQQYEAFGVAQIICSNAGSTIDLGGGQRLCSPSGPSTSSGIKVITNTTNWYSVRVGGQTEYRLTRRFSVRGSAALLPLSILENKDTHHLRGDLQQNPSISMIGVGIGANADAGVRFMITKNLGLNVGYRVWWNRTLHGTTTIHSVTGSEEFPLTQFQSVRHGLTAGLNLTF